MLPALSGALDVPALNSPTSLVSPPAKENSQGNGKYSPNGTRCTLSYRAVQSPVGLTSTAKLYTSGDALRCAAGVLPIAPVTTQLRVLRAISVSGSRNSGSLVKNGAGDSGHTIKSTLPCSDSVALDADELEAAACTLSSVSSCSVRSNVARVQFSSTGIFSCTSNAARSPASAGASTSLPACNTAAATNAASNNVLRFFLGTKKAAATATFTSMISNEIPYTPVHMVIRLREMLSTCAVPSRSQGNPVTRVRANSTATHRNGTAISARRLSRPGPVANATSKPNSP